MARVCEPADWIASLVTPQVNDIQDDTVALQASAEVVNGSPRMKLLEATRKSFSVQPKNLPDANILRILEGLKLVSWNQVTLTENYVVVTFDSSVGRKRQDQSLLASIWLRPLRVTSYVPSGPGWDVTVVTCPIAQPTVDSAWSVDQSVVLKKVSGEVLVAKGWLLEAWLQLWSSFNKEDDTALPSDTGRKVSREMIVSELGKDSGLSPPSSQSSTGAELPDPKRSKTAEFVPGKLVALDLDSRVWNVFESTGQLAVLKVQFLIRCWSTALVNDLLPGLRWSMDVFWEKVVQRATLLCRPASVEVFDVLGPQFHRLTELVQHPLTFKDNAKAFEAFLLGDVLLVNQDLLGLKSFYPSSGKLEWGKECSLVNRRQIASCIEGWSNFMTVFITTGLESTIDVLIKDLNTHLSACQYLSNFVLASEVWFLIASFMGNVKTKYSIILGGSALVLSSVESLKLVLADQITRFLIKARKNEMDYNFEHYQNNILPFQRRSSPQKPILVPGDREVHSKKQQKKEAPEKRQREEQREKEKSNRGATGSFSTVKSGEDSKVCRFHLWRLLGLKQQKTGELFACSIPKCCFHHHDKLDDVPKETLVFMKGLPNAPAEAKEAITKYLLNSK